MAKRQQQTLMDYMVIGISPALIMALVGSLLFFLLTVFYHGQHEGRLTFIFAMFVMAIVLIAHISMEEGIEYATLFAIPLGLVTAIAMMRFVRIDGPLSGLSLFINVGLMALVWWSAHKLTWDCTLIDDTQDASGEGLLQGMGFAHDAIPDDGSERLGETASSPRDTDKKTQSQDHLPLWWRRMVDRRHRPHTPGVWVVYYSIAALVLFGIGQLCIPASNPAARLSVFRYLFVYVASALGLLLTTSFLGLRRYLRQRGLHMPGDMAGMWLGIGAIMILALLLFCVLLPRPGAEMKVSQIPFSFSSPDHSRTHQQAVGNDGPNQPARATSVRPDAPQTGPQAPQQQVGRTPTKSDQQGSAGRSGAADAGPRNSPPQQSQSGDSPPDRQATDTRAPSDPEDRSPSESKAHTGQSQQMRGAAERDQQNASQQEASQQERGDHQADAPQSPSQQQTPHSHEQRDGTSGDQRRDSHEQSAPQPPNQQHKQPQSNREPQPSDPQRPGQQSAREQQPQSQPADDRPPRESPPDDPGRPRQSSQNQRPATQPDGDGSPPERDSSGKTFARDRDESSAAQASQTERPESSRQSGSQSSRSTPSSFSVTRLLSGLVAGLGTLLKLLFWGVLLLVLAYFTWKYRDRVLQAIRQLLGDLRSFWAALLGGRRDRDEQTDTAASLSSVAPPRPFASYSDPFAGGKATQYTTEQLIRYSFEAMEAWARERACARTLEQTPLEFARHVALEHPGLGMEAQSLADLYSRVAYGHERIAADRRSVLEQLWRHMRSTAAMPDPPAK